MACLGRGGVPFLKRPSAKRRKSTAPSPSPSPIASALTFRPTSSAASSSSNLASALACSATCLAAAPRPGPAVPPSVSWMGMSPPVDQLGREDAGDECKPRDEERARPGALPGRARLGCLYWDGLPWRRSVRRSLTADAGGDEARLQL